MIERLESRIAPAAAIVAYTDIDGDKVRITDSSGHLTMSDLQFVGGGTSGQLLLLDLANAGFEGANITFSVTKGPQGDGLANVGFIDASGDLGTVTIKGDLGAITAGTGSMTKLAIKSLNVRSMGVYGLATQGGTGSLNSTITGTLGALVVSGSVDGAKLAVSGDIKSITIGGSLIGEDTQTGVIVGANIGPVKIAHDIRGGAGNVSGFIESTGNLASITLGGSLIGGPGANSGEIASSGNMGKVTIMGDLQGNIGISSGLIDAGGGTLTSVNIRGSVIGGQAQNAGEILSAGNIGSVVIGGDVQGGSDASAGSINCTGNLTSAVIGGSLIGGSGTNSGDIISSGSMGSVKIGGNVVGGLVVQTGYITSGGTLGSVSIGGSLIGAGEANTGEIYSPNSITSVTVGHDVIGSIGSHTGTIESSFGKIQTVSIGGSLIGGSGDHSGSILCDFSGAPVVTIASVKIGHDVRGGSGSNSGSIISHGNLGNITVGGSLIGGTNTETGAIFSNGSMGAIKVGGDLRGGSISGTASSLFFSGIIDAGGRIASVLVGGSIISGVNDSIVGHNLEGNAGVRAGNDIGSLTVKGSLLGNVTANGAATPVIISANGQLLPTATTDIAIGRISIGGSVERAQILAGYDTNLSALNGNAQIGAVTVGGDWIDSSMAAGVTNTNGPGFLGDGHDSVIGDLANSIARIASITITGMVAGSGSPGEHFGFVSHFVGPFKSLGFSVPATSAPETTLPPTVTQDVAILAV